MSHTLQTVDCAWECEDLAFALNLAVAKVGCDTGNKAKIMCDKAAYADLSADPSVCQWLTRYDKSATPDDCIGDFAGTPIYIIDENRQRFRSTHLVFVVQSHVNIIRQLSKHFESWDSRYVIQLSKDATIDYDGSTWYFKEE